MRNDKPKATTQKPKVAKKPANGKKAPVVAETALGKYGRELRKMTRD